VKVAVEPLHTAVLPGCPEMAGATFATVTVTLDGALTQPLPSVTVTAYVVVLEGEAVGLASVALLNPVEGLQL
jgi:hypothetical protein